MNRTYFTKLEQSPDNTIVNMDEVIDQLAFNQQGLIPVITQDASSKEVLMFAWMNRESLELTLSTKRVTYWSRSRQQLWKKGESSGHTQELLAMSFDCDGDVILCQVNQTGAACHTGRPDCFYLKVDLEQRQIRISGDAGK